MNLEELKTSWKVLDERISASQKISEDLAVSILRNRSKSTVSKIQNQLKKLFLFFVGLFILFACILTGNPFDYSHWYEFIPATTYILLLVAGLKIIIQEIFSINKITLNKANLRESLQAIIDLHYAYKAVMDKIWKISLLIGFSMAISLMVRNFEKYGFLKSGFLILGNALIVMIVYRLTKTIFKQVPDKNLDELTMDLQELNAE